MNTKTRPAYRLLAFLDRWLPLIEDVVLPCALIAFLILFIVTAADRTRSDPPQIPSGAVIYTDALAMPTTAETVVFSTVKLIDNFEKNPAGGYLTYLPEQTMTQGVTERVAAVISLSDTGFDQIIKDVFKNSRGTVTTEQLDEIAPLMSAKLYPKSANSGLTIEDRSSVEQTIERGRATTWNWDVTPAETGRQELDLVISVSKHFPDGTHGTHDARQKTKIITVTVNRVFGVRRFFKDNLATFLAITGNRIRTGEFLHQSGECPSGLKGNTFRMAVGASTLKE